MDAERVRVRLSDMLLAMERIELIVREIDLEGYRSSFEKQWLVERGVQIVSEASRHIEPALTELHPEVPWGKIRAIGNRLRHEYEHVDAFVMWTIATQHLPELKPVVAEILANLPPKTSP
jgi:uncharacterized protein with HEPN domain